MTYSLRHYRNLKLTSFSLAFENCNSPGILCSKTEYAEFEVDRDRFLELVEDLKKIHKDWWNTCSALRDRGYHAEVSHALSLANDI